MTKKPEKSHINGMKIIDLLFSKPHKPHIVSTGKRTDGGSDYIMPEMLFGGIKMAVSIMVYKQ